MPERKIKTKVQNTLWRAMPKDILDAIRVAERGVKKLKKLSGTVGMQREFTLDGRLVGDIGELVVARHYEIVLNDKPKGHAHDLHAMINGKKKGVQVKLRRAATTKIDFKYRPELLIVLEIKKDWSGWREIYHGSGKIITDTGVTMDSEHRLKRGNAPTSLSFTLGQLQGKRSTQINAMLTAKVGRKGCSHA